MPRALTISEWKYLEACMEVADGDGEHAAEFDVDCGELQAILQAIVAELDGLKRA